MPDWIAYVNARLGALQLPGDERAQVTEELAAHLEETYLSLRAKGVPEADALRLATAQVENWQKLREEICSAKQEDSMENRIAQLWVPGLITFLGTASFLAVLEYLRIEPLVFHAGTPSVFVVHILWLVSLPLFGALGAFLSRRANAPGLAIHLSSAFPALVMAAAMVPVVPVALMIDRHVPLQIKTAAMLAGTLNWVVMPGMALLLGDFLFQLVWNRRAASR